jgi:hypothetical protein
MNDDDLYLRWENKYITCVYTYDDKWFIDECWVDKALKQKPMGPYPSFIEAVNAFAEKIKG